MKKAQHNQSGFTMIEMLVAIFIFTVATVSFLGVIMNGYYSSRESVNTAIASNLAQEGIELIEAKRYSNSVSTSDPVPPSWTGFADANQCAAPNGCTVNPFVSVLASNYIVSLNSSTVPFIKLDQTRGYGDLGGTDTKFARKIIVSTPTSAPNPPSYVVTSEVTWKSGLSSRKVSFTKYVTIWDNTPTP